MNQDTETRMYPRHLTEMLKDARTKPARREYVMNEFYRIGKQHPGDKFRIENIQCLIELFLDGTLGLAEIPLLQELGESLVRRALADELGPALSRHLNCARNPDRDAADNLAYWYCNRGLDFERLHITEPTLLSPGR